MNIAERNCHEIRGRVQSNGPRSDIKDAPVKSSGNRGVRGGTWYVGAVSQTAFFSYFFKTVTHHASKRYALILLCHHLDNPAVPDLWIDFCNALPRHGGRCACYPILYTGSLALSGFDDAV
ncbi:hypothetical protein QAD02_019925 [Eretmocerus hayati]|uniref:Uncharacterized protein n=1 Tax=Eretmocerus hayati TaxID=131215 RepID=A0ACC2PM56_9HYME|nr:hypothetical protein QAD02_019925 [Eretmocerus hayati]